MPAYLELLRRRVFASALIIVAVSALVALTGHRPADAQQFLTTVQWTSVGPSGGQIGSGKVNAIALVQSNPKILYIGAGWGNTPRESPSQSGIFRSLDRGLHWAAVDNGLTNPDGTISSVINGLWLDQSNPSVVLAATEFGGTFRTTNGGNTWSNVDRSESTQFAKSGSTLYVASSRGVLASLNDGATWTVSLSIASGVSTVVSAGGATYAGTMSGDVYRLNGTVWSKTGHPGTGAVHDLAVDPFNKNIVYANVDDQGAWNENLYGSINGGVTWKAISCFCSVGAQAIAFSLVVPHRLYLGDNGGGNVYYFTADGNPNPNLNFGASPFGVDLRYIVPAPGGSRTDDSCYLLMDQGLFFAARCTSGTAPGLSDNLRNTLAYDVKVTPNSRNAIVPLQDNSAAASTDGGSTWTYPNGASAAGEGAEAIIDPANPQHCYYAHPDYGLWVSTDACASFSGTVGAGTESVTFDPSRAGKLYAILNSNTSSAQINVSTDSGNTWNPTPWRFTNPYQVLVSPTDAKTIVVATGLATATPHLFYTHNGGTTWLQASGLPSHAAFPPGVLYFPVNRFYVSFDPKHSGTVLLADHDPSTDNILVFRSVDNAKTFALVKTFVQPPPSRPWPHLNFPRGTERTKKIRYYATRFFGNRLAFNPQARTGITPAVILTTRFGAFASFDDGTTWQRIDTAAISHHFVGISWNNGFVYLASFGQGVIRSSTPLQ